jgi:TIR domain
VQGSTASGLTLEEAAIEPTSASSLRVFVSYRREDASDAAGRIYDRLAPRYGPERVFLDMDNIPAGADFVEVITRAVASCDVLIAVIGKRWLTIRDGEGRRLDNPLDFVHLEIAAALERGVVVVPALVQGVKMPKASQLPERLRELAKRQAVQPSADRFDSEMGRLIRALDAVAESNAERARAELEQADRERKRKARAEEQRAKRERADAEALERERTAAEERARQAEERERKRREKLERDTIAARLATADSLAWDELSPPGRKRYYDLLDLARDPSAEPRTLAELDGRWWGELDAVERAQYRVLLESARRPVSAADAAQSS